MRFAGSFTFVRNRSDLREARVELGSQHAAGVVVKP
jgi:hypothetical protein